MFKMILYKRAVTDTDEDSQLKRRFQTDALRNEVCLWRHKANNEEKFQENSLYYLQF